MKLQVRTGIFETNSSSTHAMTMCLESDWNAFLKGEKVINRYSLKLYDSVEEGMKKEDEWNNDEESFFTKEELDQWLDNVYYENFFDKFTTPSGETVISYGYYGYDE